MKNLDPVLKFVSVLICSLIMVFQFKPFLGPAVFAACLIAAAIYGANLKAFAPGILAISVAAAAMFMTGFYFNSGIRAGAVMGWFVDEGVMNGLLLAGRILAFAGIGILFTSTTDRTDFVRALNQKMGLPPKYAYGLMAAWGILPNMALEYRKTKAAFRARGAARSPFSPALIIPLLVKSVRWSEALACAMESKGFDENAARTHYRSYPVGAPDILFLTVSVTSLITAILVL